MNQPRPRHWLPWIVLLGLLLPPGLLAQTETPTTTPQQGPTPSELYRDVKVLRLLANLELTTSQIEKILPVVQQIAEQAVADQQADDSAWGLAKAAGDKVIASLLAGVDPPQAETSLLDQAAQERNRREDFRAGLAAEAAVQIQRMLTAEQAARIETAAEQARRKAVQARLGGAETPVDYILMKLDEQAELMPDEYVRTRQERAMETAQALLGGDSPQTRALADALLRDVMDEVAQWDAAKYAQQRSTLGEQITKTLRLPPAPEQHAIRYEDFIAWITSERTPPVLREALAARKAAETKEGMAP